MVLNLYVIVRGCKMLAKIVDGQIKFAGGKVLEHDGWITTNPREEDFIDAGYKPVVGERLEEKEGFYQVPEYTEEEDKIVATYHYEEIPDDETV